MRWCWIDRFLEFESGRRAQAVKQISPDEEYLLDHFPGYPVMPRTLVLEWLAQVGGLLIFEHGRFGDNPILAKVPKVQFAGEALPGDTLTYTVSLECLRQTGAVVAATCHVNERLHAEAEIVFACFFNGHEKGALFDREVFMRMLRDLGAFAVGRAVDGSPLVAPRDAAGIQQRGREEVELPPPSHVTSR